PAGSSTMSPQSSSLGHIVPGSPLLTSTPTPVLFNHSQNAGHLRSPTGLTVGIASNNLFPAQTDTRYVGINHMCPPCSVSPAPAYNNGFYPNLNTPNMASQMQNVNSATLANLIH